MLAHLRKSVCIALMVSVGSLSLASIDAQDMKKTTNRTIAYNKHGNIIIDNQSLRYRYNPLNQLTRDRTLQHIIVYQYYANDIQASESVTPGLNNTSSTRLYHYYAGREQLLNSVQDKNFSAYLLANGITLRIYHTYNSSQKAQIFVRNRHGSVITMISSKITQTQQYNAYGTTILNGLSSSARTPEIYGISVNPLAYGNYPFDIATNLYYLKARYYTSIYRTFLSRDSYDLGNRYWYGNDHPLAGTDPTGHAFWENIVDLTKSLLPIKMAKLQLYGADYQILPNKFHMLEKTLETNIAARRIQRWWLRTQPYYEGTISPHFSDNSLYNERSLEAASSSDDEDSMSTSSDEKDLYDYSLYGGENYIHTCHRICNLLGTLQDTPKLLKHHGSGGAEVLDSIDKSIVVKHFFENPPLGFSIDRRLSVESKEGTFYYVTGNLKIYAQGPNLVLDGITEKTYQKLKWHKNGMPYWKEKARKLYWWQVNWE